MYEELEYLLSKAGEQTITRPEAEQLLTLLIITEEIPLEHTFFIRISMSIFIDYATDDTETLLELRSRLGWLTENN